MNATLYSVGISHPAQAAKLMLDHKGVEAKVVELPPGAQQPVLRALGFRGGTVPAMKIDGRRVQGSLAIARALDEAQPDPPLYPADPEARRAVEEAERWGEREYQPVPRRIFRWAMTSQPRLRAAIAAQLGLPAPQILGYAFVPMAQAYVRMEGGGEAAARRDAGAIGAHLDHVDALIAGGVIGGEELNAADFQIATTTRVLSGFDQIGPLVTGRPAAEHALRVAGRPGRDPGIRVPSDWLA